MNEPREIPEQWGKLAKRSDECWSWQGLMQRDGYGKFSGRQAHCMVYESIIGPVPEGMELDHLCRNKVCVNPDHLEPVTHRENMRRRFANYTHCKHGHEYTPENTYVMPSGTRDCRACIRRRAAKYKAKRRAAR